ncbi:MAG: thioredoxin family protein [Alkalispirochaetaceae bacterium]
MICLRAGFFGFALLLVAATIPGQELSWYESLDDARTASVTEGKNLLILVTAGAWCTPCAWVEEELFGRREIAERIAEQYVALRLYDYDEAHLELPVDAYPSILIYAPGGSLLETLTGPPPAPVLEALLTRYREATPESAEARRFSTDRGTFVYVGAGSWERRVEGRSVTYMEYDRDEEFIYLESDQEPRFLALPAAGGEMWQWDPITEGWEDFSLARPE